MRRFVAFFCIVGGGSLCWAEGKDDLPSHDAPPLKHVSSEVILTEENQQEIERVDDLLAQRQRNFFPPSSVAWNDYVTEGVPTPT